MATMGFTDEEREELASRLAAAMSSAGTQEEATAIAIDTSITFPLDVCSRYTNFKADGLKEDIKKLETCIGRLEARIKELDGQRV